ncbi:hypothetical protein Javan290_0048 [Streptococcus phage Javan290]|nr:hypothetical protein Javan290_0048 [Streptococcus phage Javan290]
MSGLDKLFAMQSWSWANDCHLRMSEKVRLMSLSDQEFKDELERMAREIKESRYVNDE